MKRKRSLLLTVTYPVLAARGSLSRGGGGKQWASAGLSQLLGHTWRNLFLPSRSPEGGPPWLKGGKRKWRKQIRISRALKEHSSCRQLQDFSRKSAHKPLGVPYLGISPLGPWASPTPQVLNPHLLPFCGQILLHAPECCSSESRRSSWSILRRMDQSLWVREKLQLKL